MSISNLPRHDWIKELTPLTDAFAVPERLIEAGPYGNGHINETYVLVTKGDAKGGRKRYVAQKINHRIFKNVPALMDNVRRVTAHLGKLSPRALALVPTRSGEALWQDPAGNWWRLYDFIEGAHTVDQATSEAQSCETARAFGAFQAQLADLPGGRLHETIQNFHHTRDRFEKLRAALAADVKGRAVEVRDELAFAFAREAETDVLVGFLARGEVKERVTHNDTKINNVMLDDITGRGVAVIDLDTVMPGLALYDFGEMVRTSASSTAEDDPDPSRMHVRLPLFRQLVMGYLETAGGVLNATERGHLGFAGKMMAYENGIRFLTDYLQGDVYFRIKQPQHNLVRCRTQFALVRSIEAERDAMARIVAEIYGSSS
ncbi:MAG: aminoglycoside phosphotransferase family protein [Verrucomicrobiota bacterium]